MKYTFALLTALLLVPLAALRAAEAKAGILQPVELTCEALKNPEGIDAQPPRLSWKLESEKPGDLQTAYQIIAASSPEKLAADTGNFWDTGRVKSDETLWITYAGKPLKSSEQVWWKLKVWDKDGKESAWSEVQYFSIGLLSSVDWKAKWIAAPPVTPEVVPHYGYRSTKGSGPQDAKWIQIDLGNSVSVDGVRLWGSFPREKSTPPAEGFPVRFKIEGSDNPEFKNAKTLVDRTAADLPSPELEPALYTFTPVSSRYIKLTAVKLDSGSMPVWDQASDRFQPKRTPRDWVLALAEMEVLSSGKNVALGKTVTAKDEQNKPPHWSKKNLVDGRTEGSEGSLRDHTPVTLLRKQFALDKKVRRATLYATALGSYEFYLNGTKVGDHLLAPGQLLKERRVLYQTHDVTDLLNAGDNMIGAMLADGWYRKTTGYDYFENFQRFPPKEPRKLLGQLEIEFEDGQRQMVGTDASWQCNTNGPMLRSTIFSGYVYDARKEIPNWSRPQARATAAWGAVIESPLGSVPKLSAQMMPPIRKIREIAPAKRTEPRPGMFVYDFGERMSGVCRIRVKGNAGQMVTIRYSEAITPEGLPYGGNLAGLYMVRDRFILDGDASRVMTPLFTYHGFQYATVEGVNSADDIIEIAALETVSDLKRVTEFSSSDPRLDKLVSIVDRAFLSSALGFMVDVTGRDERNPWLGDCFRMETLPLLYDFAAFGANNIRGIFDSVNKHGIPPQAIIGVLSDNQNAEPCWSDVMVYALYEQWLHYAHHSKLEEGYQYAARFIDSIAAQMRDGVPGDNYQAKWGDHLESRNIIPPGAKAWEPKGGRGMSRDLFASATLFRTVTSAAKMAGALGKKEDATRYQNLAEEIRSAIIRDYMKEDGTVTNGVRASKLNKHLGDQVNEDGTVKTDEQGSYAYLLGLDILQGELRTKANHKLLEAIDRYVQHLSTGTHSTIFLLKYLAENGYQDLALKMVMQPTYPSFGFIVDRSTSMWERFDAWIPGLGFNPHSMNGLNHLGANPVFTWIFNYVGGIRPGWSHPGYKHFFIEPKPVAALTSMRMSYNCIRGRIECNYRLAGGTITYELLVPPSTTATFILPNGTKQELKSGRHTISHKIEVKK